MSRIHEALSQAGVKPPSVDDAPQVPASVLADFPPGSENPTDVAADRRPTEERQRTTTVRPTFADRLIAHDDAESGRGLHLIQELADRWGWPTGLRTSVWFEIDRVSDSPRVPTTTIPAPLPRLRLAT